ncbi:UNVERIFIED_CONTAM: hypothetical protein HDU68_010017 [Siphonaria sp. JEL0065]|nr:hypothetical protein HDU68_010017 [Siphonaria sp. JEL0065]
MSILQLQLGWRRLQFHLEEHSVAISGALFNNIIASDIDNYPILTNAIAQLQANGIEIQPTEVLPLSQLLTTLDFVTNGVQANADLIHVFNGAFKIAYLSLLAYPLIILLVAFLIKEDGD